MGQKIVYYAFIQHSFSEQTFPMSVQKYGLGAKDVVVVKLYIDT